MYRQCIISFIDLLGFKDIIQNSSAEDIRRRLSIVRDFSGLGDFENGEGYAPKVIQFSDSIIRIRPIDSEANRAYNYGIVFHELLDLVHMQSDLINSRIPVRGGVSIGDVFYDEQTIFGPGFVRAYELESTFANYPRIVVDPEILSRVVDDSDLRSSHNDLENELGSIRNLLKCGDDGIHFIDYLKSYQSEIDDFEDIPTYLENHKSIIQSNINRFNSLNPISSKYLWMAKYHNEVVCDLSPAFFTQWDLERDDFLISDTEMPILRDFGRPPLPRRG
ncbi:hypothetical protein [Pseudomonas aeruginosa]|uniref:hypothetical protein n=1 Tax=Pseudomonas aeruginosa TaxID=287 RepID=UPI000ABFB38A|nr:hypothetical protein [Pseudomonas aeruginosa]